MKVINFFSYRGGVGRTTLTVQIARLLAAMGKKVIIVDLDFDAPGIPVAFGKDNRNDVSAGIIDLFSKYKPTSIYSNADEEKLKTSKVQSDIQDLVKYLNVKIDLKGERNTGCIDILPCGRVDADYWIKMSDPSWIELHFEPDENDENVKRFKGSLFRNFFINVLIPALASEPLAYEYMLIDARAGVTHYGAISESVTNHEVVVFCPNDEVEHINEAINEFSILYPRDPNFKRTYILSRVPYELGSIIQTAFEKIKKRIENDDLLIVHSDLEMLIDPRKRDIDSKYREIVRDDGIKWHDDIVLVHEDFLKIFDRLCPEIFDESFADEQIKYKIASLSDNELKLLFRIHSVWEQIFENKYKFAVTNKKRLFELHGLTGEMKNPDDGKRNVAFKVVTFLNILNNFYETLLITSHTRIKCIEMLNEALFSAGQQCGEIFGQALSEDWQLDKKHWDFGSGAENTVIIWENILRWCKFDTEAGFGKMDCNREKRTLRADNLFVIDSETTQGRDYTAFFTGYVLGVLSKIIGPHEVNILEMGRIKMIGGREVPTKKHIQIYNSDDKEVVYPTDLKTTKADTGVEYKIVIKSLP